MSSIPKGVALTLPFTMYGLTTGLPVGGLTVASTISKDGAAFGAPALGTVVDLGNGNYTIALNDADMDAQTIKGALSAPGAMPTHFTIITDEAPSAAEIAEAVLTTPISTYESGSHPFRSLYGLIAKLTGRTKNNLSTSKVEVYETDDVTLLATQSVATNASAEPVVEVNTD